MLDGLGEETMNGLIVNADRGYGKEVFMATLAEFGIGSEFFIPDTMIMAYPFVAV